MWPSSGMWRAVRLALPRPIFWIVGAEVVVVAALLAFAWHLFQSQSAGGAAPGAGGPVSVPGNRARPTAEPRRSPAVTPPSPSAAPKAGRLEAQFPVDLSRLNRDQAALEQAQSSLVARLSAALRDYLERVVVPAVLRAESASTATSAATRQSPAASRKIP